MAQRYRLILFDCVNTLLLPDPSRLPRVELDGESVPSTAGLLLEELRALEPTLDAARVHAAARSAWRWSESQRGPELREVSALERFRHLLGELGLPASDDAFVQRLLEAHMAAVTGTFVFPAAHRELLTALRGRFRLALFSNFDHGPSLLRLLRETGIHDWFDPLLISDGLGYRKPGARAFDQALAHMGLPRAQILFVGDSVEDDVRGGHAAGLDVAWINPRGEPAPADCPPRYQLPALPALAALLGD